MVDKKGIVKKHVYEIKVLGELDKSWSDWFDNMTVTFEYQPNDPTMTVITGEIVDQSALLGLLHKIGYLNLEIISVNRLNRFTSGEKTKTAVVKKGGS